MAAAQAQVTAVSQTVLKQMPAGITPPLVLSYNASSVPVLALQISSDQLTGSQLYDMASNLIRPMLVSVPGVAIPAPYGGTPANVQVDLDQQKLLAHGLSAQDVSHALAQQNIVLPAGDQKIGAIDFLVETNASPVNVATFNALPIKQVGGAVVTVGDVAHVYLGGPPQTNSVLVHGQQAVLLEVLKAGDASTLAVVAGVKAKIPQILRTLPAGVKITTLNDASTFVRASVEDVVQEMVMAAVLTGLVVLLFLGSGRSTLIVATSIPLSILCSILALAWCGQTINVMTLGGLALAVGILVDDATVMIENIDAHLATGLELRAGDHRSGEPDRDSNLRLDAVHLHRLVAAVPVIGRRRLPVSAAGRSHRLRDDRLLHPLAHAGADDGGLSAACAGCGAQGGRGAERPLRPVPSGVRATLRSVSRPLSESCWPRWLRGAADSSSGSWRRRSPR